METSGLNRKVFCLGYENTSVGKLNQVTQITAVYRDMLQISNEDRLWVFNLILFFFSCIKDAEVEPTMIWDPKLFIDMVFVVQNGPANVKTFRFER